MNRFILAPIFFVFFILYFFRDPRRVIKGNVDVILSPADGRIISSGEANLINGQEFTRICIFLSLFDVHIIRSPIKGKVESLECNKGEFINALSKKASAKNENIIMGLRNDNNQIIVKMITGLVARRIVCYRQKQDSVGMGEKIGRIMFGSRVEIFIPNNRIDYIKVKIGDRVLAGITELCSLRH